MGYSRAVVAGDHVYVAGTAPIPADGSDPPEGAYEQTRLCLEIVEGALERAGARLEDVVRTLRLPDRRVGLRRDGPGARRGLQGHPPGRTRPSSSPGWWIRAGSLELDVVAVLSD